MRVTGRLLPLRETGRGKKHTAEVIPLPGVGQLAYPKNSAGQNTFGQQPKPAPRASTLRLLSPSDCADSPPRSYVVKGLLAPRDLFLMVAKPGGGKSALAPSIGYAIAQGRPVFGRRTKPGLVLYVAVEDPHGMRSRVHALKREHGDTDNFLTVEGVSDLFSPDSPDPDALLELARQHRPALIVIDTLAAAWRGMEENECQDMARVISVCRGLTDQRCAVMLLCHPNKMQQSDGTARGHSSLNGEADVGLFLEWAADRSAIFSSMTKNRNGPATEGGMAFTIKAVCIGMDEDDDPIFAPVACEAEAFTIVGPAKKRNADTVALSILTNLIASSGKPLPETAGFPEGLRGVAQDEWQRECDSQGLSTSDQPANRKRAFKRSSDNLREKNAVGFRDGLVWIQEPKS
jgi:hypothetical protein